MEEKQTDQATDMIQGNKAGRSFLEQERRHFEQVKYSNIHKRGVHI